MSMFTGRLQRERGQLQYLGADYMRKSLTEALASKDEEMSAVATNSMQSNLGT